MVKKEILNKLHSLIHGVAKDGFILLDENNELYNPNDALKLEYNKGVVQGIYLCIDILEKCE